MFIHPAVLVLAILMAGALGAAVAGILFWIWETSQRLHELEEIIGRRQPADHLRRRVH
jgi:hypothetical protein